MGSQRMTAADLERLAHEAIVAVIEVHDLALTVAASPVANGMVLPHGVGYRVDWDGTARPRLVISRPMHRLEGRHHAAVEKAVATGRTAAASVAAAVDQLFDPYVRLVHRDRQFSAAGLDIVDGIHAAPAPAWGYAISPVLLACLRSRGMTPDDIARAAVDDRRALASNRHMSKHKLFLNDARITAHRTEMAPGVFHDELKAIPRICFHKRLPVTILNGLTGRQARDVIAHPWLEGVDAVVMAVRNRTNAEGDDAFGPGVIELELFVPDVLAGDIPNGIGGPWHLSHLRHGPRRP